MKNAMLLLAIVAITSAVSIPIGIQSASAWDPFANPLGNKDFEVTIEVHSVAPIPSGENGDGSYYLIYGLDPDSHKERIIEIQVNIWSVGANLSNLKKVNRDYPLMKLLDRANYGSVVKFKCNGWNDLESLEHYAQCNQILTFTPSKKIVHGDLSIYSTDEIQREIKRLQAEVSIRS